MAAFLCGAVVSRAASWLALRRTGIGWRWSRGSDKAVLGRLVGSMGRGYALYGALILTLLQADVLILGLLGGPQMVAEFVLIWKIADVGIQALWRIPESLQPYIVQMDVRADHPRLRRVYAQGQAWMSAIAAIAAVAYAVLGPAVVRLWVGPEHAPDAPWGFALAGAAVFWLVSARLPAVFAFSLLRLRALNVAAAIEVGAKLVLMLALFPIAGYYSPLIAINAAHACGVAVLYRRLSRPL
jgi:O-antigen/teichoic acid export membrane protein